VTQVFTVESRGDLDEYNLRDIWAQPDRDVHGRNSTAGGGGASNWNVLFVLADVENNVIHYVVTNFMNQPNFGGVGGVNVDISDLWTFNGGLTPPAEILPMDNSPTQAFFTGNEKVRWNTFNCIWARALNGGGQWIGGAPAADIPNSGPPTDALADATVLGESYPFLPGGMSYQPWMPVSPTSIVNGVFQFTNAAPAANEVGRFVNFPVISYPFSPIMVRFQWQRLLYTELNASVYVVTGFDETDPLPTYDPSSPSVAPPFDGEVRVLIDTSTMEVMGMFTPTSFWNPASDAMMDMSTLYQQFFPPTTGALTNIVSQVTQVSNGGFPMGIQTSGWGDPINASVGAIVDAAPLTVFNFATDAPEITFGLWTSLGSGSSNLKTLSYADGAGIIGSLPIRQQLQIQFYEGELYDTPRSSPVLRPDLPVGPMWLRARLNRVTTGTTLQGVDVHAGELSTSGWSTSWIPPNQFQSTLEPVHLLVNIDEDTLYCGQFAVNLGGGGNNWFLIRPLWTTYGHTLPTTFATESVYCGQFHWRESSVFENAAIIGTWPYTTNPVRSGFSIAEIETQPAQFEGLGVSPFVDSIMSRETTPIYFNNPYPGTWYRATGSLNVGAQTLVAGPFNTFTFTDDKADVVVYSVVDAEPYIYVRGDMGAGIIVDVLLGNTNTNPTGFNVIDLTTFGLGVATRTVHVTRRPTESATTTNFVHIKTPPYWADPTTETLMTYIGVDEDALVNTGTQLLLQLTNSVLTDQIWMYTMYTDWAMLSLPTS
jgi:hypothetical protein